MDRTIKIGLVGAGMFGGDVHLRTYADLQRCGIAGQLARIGLDQHSRDFAAVKFELVAIATRSKESAARSASSFQQLLSEGRVTRGPDFGKKKSGIRVTRPSGKSRSPRTYSGNAPWLDILHDFPDLDVLAVATPDQLHTPVILAGLNAGAHVITEKPMCLDIAEADKIIERARTRNRIVAVDMHKRYDPDHQRIRNDIRNRIGEPLYGTAYLEEPLEVSTNTFKWVEQSDPFSYVGPHWVDLIYHYYKSKPVSLTAVGQKKRLVRDGINAFDAVQVRVDFANGMSINFHNNWITPPEFEGPVNQGHEIVGADGKVESDQQYRGFRWWNKGGGSRTANNHFTRDVKRPDGSEVYVGYGVDSIIAGIVAICRIKFLGENREAVAEIYPTAEDARVVVAIVHAARLVRDLNFKYLRQGKGAAVTARFGPDGITIVDPNRASEGKVFQRIYERAI